MFGLIEHEDSVPTSDQLNLVFHLMWRHKVVFQCSAVCQSPHCSYIIPFFVTLILSKVICYSWTSLCDSGSILSSYWSELLPHSDLSFWTDNPSVHRHVRCLSVWRTPLIRLGEGFCDKHATSHRRLTLQNRFKEIWEATRVSHLSVLFGLHPRSCMSVFKCIWAGLFVCVWGFVCPNSSLLVPVSEQRVNSLKLPVKANSKVIHNRAHHVTERSQVSPVNWQMRTFSTFLFRCSSTRQRTLTCLLTEH